MYQDNLRKSESGSGQTDVRSFDYDEIAENCIRYFGINSFDEIDKLSLREYNILMQAHNLRQIDEEYKQYKAAWLNVQAGAMKQQGKRQVPVFKKFRDFFDYKEALKAAKEKETKESGQFDRLSKHLREKIDG